MHVRLTVAFLTVLVPGDCRSRYNGAMQKAGIH
jgi:hypothetical protein